ncbi:hypothetical protein MUK42_36907 [Musa troglodytarum]|uniref:Uncharacterized protein n=1 Tax=Musa troglodytarum TaxID=320322 RepID=A0A9E7FJ78_9LILI|nr:hypothetical protein MUK42_36907 [Musa troglodytarum]
MQKRPLSGEQDRETSPKAGGFSIWRGFSAGITGQHNRMMARLQPPFMCRYTTILEDDDDAGSGRRSLAGDEVGGVGPGVVGDGVGEVVVEVLDGALAGDDGLHEEAEHGEHGKAAVLDLLHLELREGVGVVGQAQGVEGAAGVDGVEALAQRAAADAVALHEAHQHHLAGPDGEDALRVDQVGVAQVVEAALREDLRPGLEPHRLPELDAVLRQDLREDAPQRPQHRPPPVDHLQLPVLRERLRVRRQPRRVPPVVARELARQVRRRLLREGPQMLLGVLAAVRRMKKRPLEAPTLRTSSFCCFRAVWPAKADCWSAEVAIGVPMRKPARTEVEC